MSTSSFSGIPVVVKLEINWNLTFALKYTWHWHLMG